MSTKLPSQNEVVLVEVPLNSLLHWLLDRKIVTDANWETSSLEIQETIQQSLKDLSTDINGLKQLEKEQKLDNENVDTSEIGVYQELLTKFLIINEEDTDERHYSDGRFTSEKEYSLRGSSNTLRDIDFYQCQEIMDLLIQNEERKGVKLKNIFGYYRNPFLRTWNNLLNGYGKHNIFLASSASQLISLASYALPSLKRSLKTNDKILNDLNKRIEDIQRRIEHTRKDFEKVCSEYKIDFSETFISQQATTGKGSDEIVSLVEESSNKFSPLIPTQEQIAEKILITTFESKVFFENIIESLKSNDLLITIQYYDSFLFSKMKNVMPRKLGNAANTDHNSIEEPHSILQNNISPDISTFEMNQKIDAIQKLYIPTLKKHLALLHNTGNYLLINDDIHKEHRDEEKHHLVKSMSIQENQDLLNDQDSRMKLLNDLLELQSFLKIRHYECSQDENILLFQNQSIPNIYASFPLNQINNNSPGEKQGQEQIEDESDYLKKSDILNDKLSSKSIPVKFQEAPSFLLKCKQDVEKLLGVLNDKYLQHLLLIKQSSNLSIMEGIQDNDECAKKKLDGAINEENVSFFGKYLQHILSRFKAFSVQEHRLHRSMIDSQDKKIYYLELQKETNQKYLHICQNAAKLKTMIEESTTSIINSIGSGDRRQFLITECDF